MQASSYLELVTQLYGWHFYSQLWGLLVDSGLVWVPFLVILWTNWSEAFPKGSRGAEASLKKMEFGVYGALMILWLAAWPTVKFSAHQITYTAKSGQTTTAAGAGSEIGNWDVGRGVQPSEVRMPAFAMLVTRVTQGINASTRKMTGDPSLAELAGQLKHLNIQSAPVLYEVQQFYRDCYHPSLARFQDRVTAPEGIDERYWVVRYREAGLNADTSWIGSRTFIENRGYYRPCEYPEQCGTGYQARSPLAGWPYVPERDNLNFPETSSPEAGATTGEAYPYCDEWWMDPERGLRQKLIVEAQRHHTETNWGAGNLWDDMRLYAAKVGIADERDAEDAIIKRMLNQAAVKFTRSVEREENNDSTWSYITEFAQQTATFAGASILYLVLSVIMEAVTEALPVIQALLLFGVVVLAPAYWLIAGYTAESAINFLLAIFSLMFLTSMWELAAWVDNSLFVIVMGDTSGDPLRWMAGGNMNAELFIEIVSMTFFLLITFVWIWLMNMARSSAAGGLRMLQAEAMELGGSTFSSAKGAFSSTKGATKK